METDKERFQKMEKRALDVIEAATDAGMKYEEEEAMGDMCKAIRDLRDEEYRLGQQDGYRKGEQDGYHKAAQKMYRKGSSLEQIADILEVGVGLVEEWLEIAKA